MAAAVGIGGSTALFAAGLHLLAHGVSKALLFFVAGSVTARYGTRAIGRIRGAAQVVPVSGSALLLGALMLGGVPPSPLFMSELGLLSAGFVNGRALAALALLLCLALVFAGLIYHTMRMALGTAPASLQQGEHWRSTLLVAAPMGVLALLGLYLPPPLVRALEQVAMVLGGAS
jgi:hydrogenase-4 component F